jgi:subtilisin family serine protease
MGGPRHQALGALAAACWTLLAAPAGAAAATSTPDDAWFAAGQQWGLVQAGFPSAWCASTGAGALIAVVDGGVDFGHPDLAGKAAGSWTVPGLAPGVTGHATHVAGVAAADTDNGVGMAGAAPDARLYSAKMLDADGSGSSADLAAAIRHVTDQVAPTWPGPVVLNISVGATTSTPPPEVAAAIADADAHGLGIALAAGDQPGTSGYAAMSGQAMVVGALTRTGGVAPYSPTTGVNVFAAGGQDTSGSNVGSGIVSTYSGGHYAWLTGTSMATPYVAAALALLMSTGESNHEADQRIESTEVGGALRIDRALGRTGTCGAPVTAPSPVTLPAPRLPLTAAVPEATPNVAPVLPSTGGAATDDDATHGLSVRVAAAPRATTVVSTTPGSGRLVAATSARAPSGIGRTALAAAIGVAGAGLVSLKLWRRPRRSEPAAG